MTWGQIGRELTKKLQRLTDEPSIKALAQEVMEGINAEPTAKARGSALKMVRAEVLKAFPRLESEAPLYWHDSKGKGQDTRKWRHLIFKYLTLNSSDWDAIGDEAREEWKATQSTEQAKPTEQAKLTEEAKPTEQAKQTQKQKRTSKPKQFLKTMTIQQLELDSETEQTLQDALDHSGMSLEEFIKQAIKVYAKTVVGKSKQQVEDLSNVPTSELLTNTKYKTHPSRAEELTKRAIRAIIRHNTERATENADRWQITQSAIASLTGSRPQSVGEILKQYQSTVDDHNSKPEYGFTQYTNRKPGKKITDAINISELVPNGLE
jgi:hypothetical protein